MDYETERDLRGRRMSPAPWLEEPEPLAMAMGDGVSGGGGGLPVTSASPRSDWDIGGATGNPVNLVLCAPNPTSLYSTAIGAHQPYFSWTPPIRARKGFPSSRWARSGGDQPNILPLDLNFTFNFILYSLLVSSRISK
jgi:hypothetical protein